MPTEILMPALPPTMEEGTLAKWLVKEGDTVAKGDTLLTTEAMKMETRITSPLAGTIVSVGVRVGEQVGAGDLVVTVEP